MSDTGNHLVDGLPRSDRRRLLASCEPVELELSDVLYRVDSPTRFALFPLDGFVSLVTPANDHAGLEVGMVGREGMVGMELVLGVRTAPLHAVVQGAGTAWRLGHVKFGQELARSTALRRVLQHYVHVTLLQLATASSCRRFHAIGPRLARWLLMSQDRAQADRFRVTHEFMALMLGVRRVGVTVAAGGLQAAGLIRYHRGELTVLDRAGLEAHACACYVSDLRAYRAHMGSYGTADGTAPRR